MKESSCSFNMVKLTVNQRCCLIGMLDARMRIHDNIDPNWAIGVCKWSIDHTDWFNIMVDDLNDNHLFISIHLKIKRIGLRKKISTWGDKWFKSSTIILSQSVWSIRFTATMEMGTFHLWGAIELSILDQFWQMRCQNYCDLMAHNWQK